MSKRKPFLQIIILAFTIGLLAGCGNTPTEPTSMPTLISPPTAALTLIPPPTTAPTLIPLSTTATPTTVKSGFITGRVHLVAPPTPHMVVYALDKTTGLWAFTETAATNGEAPFNLVVSPGSYQLFAFSDSKGLAGYTLDGWTLAVVNVAANQTVSDIIVRPPSQSECGSMFGVPASPDGRFEAVTGPSADCIAAILTPAAGPTLPQTNPDAARIQFQPNAASWYTPGDLAPSATIRFVLYALEGQQMIVDLTTEPASSATLHASLYIWGADGMLYTPNPTTSWSSMLPASQDYYIEVRSISQQSINYTLSVTIPAIGSTLPQMNQPAPVSGGGYGPVSQAVCQILQDDASRALSVTFSLKDSAPFTDPLSGETGQGCSLTATGTGREFSDPGKVTANLVSAFLGWTEQPGYQSNGPTGAATAMTRDMGLMLIRVDWTPEPEAQCPPDKPISKCDLKPKQKLYTIQIQAAQK